MLATQAGYTGVMETLIAAGALSVIEVIRLH